MSSVGDGRAIGIASLAEEDREELGDIVVYLYDGDDSAAAMAGELDPSGAATLEADQDSSDFDATVELTVADDAVSGTVTFPAGEPTSFTAPAASGAGGVYWATTGPDVGGPGAWVVLADGRQWGLFCFPPPNDLFCMMRN